MKHFEITGKLTNGFGEIVSITVCNKKSGDIFYIGAEQGEELVSLVSHFLILSPMMVNKENNMSRVLLNKDKLGTDLEKVKKKFQTVRDERDVIVVIAEEKDAKKLVKMYEGLEAMNEKS